MEKYLNQVLPDEVLFEGTGIAKNQNEVLRKLKDAMESNKTLSALCSRCSEEGTLTIDLGGNITGIVPREEVAYKLGQDGLVHLGKCRDRVGLYISFKVMDIKEDEFANPQAILSRKAAMIEIKERYSKELKVGSIVEGVVVGMQSYGAFIDIGGDVSGILNVRNITKVFIEHPEEKLQIGQKVTVMVDSIEVDSTGNIVITYNRESLLPGWESIDKYFKKGETVMGRVKKISDTGVFVELNESFEGLADFVPNKNFEYGQRVRVKIDSINKERKKIKLRIV